MPQSGLGTTCDWKNIMPKINFAEISLMVEDTDRIPRSQAIAALASSTLKSDHFKNLVTGFPTFIQSTRGKKPGNLTQFSRKKLLCY